MRKKATDVIGWLLALLLGACGPKTKTGYYPTGEVEYRAPLNERGVFDGEVKHFYKNGVVRCILVFSNNHVNGIVRRFYPDGQKLSVEYYKNGDSFGLVKEYYPNGQLRYEATRYGDVYADTAYYYHPNGELHQMIVYDGRGRKADFGAWYPNGEIDAGYTRPLFLSDSDSLEHGQDYAFEVRLGNRRSGDVQVKVRVPATGVDSTRGTYTGVRYIIRRPAPGPHTVTVDLYNRWARKGSDTLWTNEFTIEHSFWVRPRRISAGRGAPVPGKAGLVP